MSHEISQFGMKRKSVGIQGGMGRLGFALNVAKEGMRVMGFECINQLFLGIILLIR